MYLPETPPLPPIKPGDPDYDPFAKPRHRSCSYRSPAPVSGPNVLHHPGDGRQTIQNDLPGLWAESKGAFP